MLKFRPHRGGWVESMTSVQEFTTIDDLVEIIKSAWAGWPDQQLPTRDNLVFQHQGFDLRNGWDTYFVIVGDEGALPGYTNGVPGRTEAHTIEAILEQLKEEAPVEVPKKRRTTRPQVAPAPPPPKVARRK